MYLVRFSKQADKDKKMLKGAGFFKIDAMSHMI